MSTNQLDLLYHYLFDIVYILLFWLLWPYNIFVLFIAPLYLNLVLYLQNAIDIVTYKCECCYICNLTVTKIIGLLKKRWECKYALCIFI